MAILKFLLLFFIISCTHSNIKHHKSYININDDDHHHDISEYSNFLQKYKNQSFTLEDSEEPAVPEIAPLPIEFPDLTSSGQLISINVSDDVPVKDLLIEVGKLADINLDIDPKISGNIILKLRIRA